MNKRIVFFAPLLICCLMVRAQFPITLNDTAYINLSLPDREPSYGYGFIRPIYANVLSANPSTYSPSAINRYFMSLFGPRYKQTSTSNIGFYDFHQGEDISPNITYNSVVYDTANKISEVCMCDGIVTTILDSTDAYLETIEQGRSVTVRCDSTFKGNPTWGNIYMNYRHLSAIDTSLKVRGVNAVIHKGDTIGKIGMSGQTEAVHLHYSIARSTPQGMKNMHPMRVFDPAAAPHLHRKMDTAVTIQLLGAWTDSALIRLAIPLNEVCLRSIKISCGPSYTRVFDFEEVANLKGRDTNTIVPGLALYAYPFNRYQSAYSRYKQLDSLMPVVYPAARFRPLAWGSFPIPNVWPYTKSMYVLDVMVSQLPAGYSYQQLVVELNDIYGTVVKGATSSSALPAKVVSFGGAVWNDEVNIHWVTASEVNVDYFVVERSTNDKEFSPLCKVKAAGNSNVLKYYAHIDQTAEKQNYYRLVTVDLNGAREYSKTIYVKNIRKHAEEINIYPNPAGKYVRIDCPHRLNNVVAIDTKGNSFLLPTTAAEEYDIHELPEGFYILECSTSSETYYRSLKVAR